MFTGLVSEIGAVVSLERLDGGLSVELTVSAVIVLRGVKLGDSISVNGVCLTVIRFTRTTFSAGLAPETLQRTNLGDLKKGSLVNLEQSLAANGKLGGHFVQGHVDGTGTIEEFRQDKDSLRVRISAAPELVRFIIPKGFVAIDGVSLTVVDVLDAKSNALPSFTFMLVKYTQEKIVLPKKKVGERVNIEVDVMGKYIVNFIERYMDTNSGARSKL